MIFSSICLNYALDFRYGRSGTYHLQDIMKIINEGIYDRQLELDNTWKVREGEGEEMKGERNLGKP